MPRVSMRNAWLVLALAAGLAAAGCGDPEAKDPAGESSPWDDPVPSPAGLAGLRDPGDEPRPVPPEDSRYLSSWGKLVLARASLVARGTVVRLFRLQNGVSVASFRIEETMSGPAMRGNSVLVVSPDPAYFGGGEELILFLRQETDGDRYEALDRVDSTGSGGAARAESIRRYVGMEALEDSAAKRAEFKKILFESLASPERWFRENAVRELYIFTEREPEAFTADEAGALLREARAARRTSDRHHLLYAVAHLEILPPLRMAAGRDPSAAAEGLERLRSLLEEAGAAEERIQFREDVVFQQYRASPDPALRAGIVRVATALDRPRLAMGILKALEDASRLVRLEALKGLRVRGSPRMAARVARRLQDCFPEVRREAALALAAIGTKNELEALEALADNRSETPEVREAARAAVEAIEARG